MKVNAAAIGGKGSTLSRGMTSIPSEDVMICAGEKMHRSQLIGTAYCVGT